ncbi:MAG: hypothetical protein NTZ17_02205 [Phycisphaerae bacterium]|nr:hypothetical protein [Phycisphaerae bacterium]
MAGSRAGQRDQEVEQMKAGELPPVYRQPPQVVAAHLDAGKIRLRAEDGRPGVHGRHWSDTKVACLQTYTSIRGEHDPRYRRDGLPATSTIVESLIKQFNQRVKGTEKFWLRGGAEALLQGRAAYRSEDDRGVAFYAHRPRGPAVGRNRLRLIA